MCECVCVCHGINAAVLQGEEGQRLNLTRPEASTSDKTD